MLERDPLTLDSVTLHAGTSLYIQAFASDLESHRMREKGRLLNKSIVQEEGPRPPACRHDLFWPRQDINVGMKNVAVGPTWRPSLALTIRKHSHVATDTHPGLRHWILSGEDFSDCWYQKRSSPLAGNWRGGNTEELRPLGLLLHCTRILPHTRDRTNYGRTRGRGRRGGDGSLAFLFLSLDRRIQQDDTEDTTNRSHHRVRDVGARREAKSRLLRAPLSITREARLESRGCAKTARLVAICAPRPRLRPSHRPPSTTPPTFHFQLLSLSLALPQSDVSPSLSLLAESEELALPIKYPLYVLPRKDNFRVKLNFTLGPTAVSLKPLHLVYIFTPGGPTNRYRFR